MFYHYCIFSTTGNSTSTVFIATNSYNTATPSTTIYSNILNTTINDMTQFTNTAVISTGINKSNYDTTAILNMTESYITVSVTNTGNPTSEIDKITHVMTSVSETSVSIAPSPMLSSTVISSTSINPTPTQSNTSLVMIVLIIDLQVDVGAASFKNDMEKKLLDTYIAAKSVFKRRKRRATTKGSITLEVSVRICVFII